MSGVLSTSVATAWSIDGARYTPITDRDELTILVGWSELGLRRVQKQLLVLYNPTANETGFEI